MRLRSAKGAKRIEIGNLKFEIPGRYPAYTRPENFMGMKVPKVLLSGDHKKIAAWRKKSIK